MFAEGSDSIGPVCDWQLQGLLQAAPVSHVGKSGAQMCGSYFCKYLMSLCVVGVMCVPALIASHLNYVGREIRLMAK